MSRNYYKGRNEYSAYASGDGVRTYGNSVRTQGTYEDTSFQNDDFGKNFSNFSSKRMADNAPAAPLGYGEPSYKRRPNDYSKATPLLEATFPTQQPQQRWNSSFRRQGLEGYYPQSHPTDAKYGYNYSEEDYPPASGKLAKRALMSGFAGPGSNAFDGRAYDDSSVVPGSYVMGPSGYGRPLYGQQTMQQGIPRIDTEVSPYYGIENLSHPSESGTEEYVEAQAVEEVTRKVKNSDAFDPENPYGKWQPAQEDVEDVEYLTRDAEIIAGVQPEQPPPASDDAVLKAMEIEVTVPSELMQADLCQLCQARFSSPQMAESHYLGKKHAQRENQYVRKIYEEKGINVTRFLTKPKAKVPTTDKKAAPIRKKFNFTCGLCHMGFENQNQVDLHVMGALHRKRLFDRQTAMLSASFGPAAPSLQEIGQFYCSLCDKALNSEQQFEMHMQSKKHKSKEENQAYY